MEAGQGSRWSGLRGAADEGDGEVDLVGDLVLVLTGADAVVGPADGEFAPDHQEVAAQLGFVDPFAKRPREVGDLDRDFGVQEYMDMATYFGGLVARTGAAGRYGDIAMNPWILRRDGIMGLTPVTGDLNRLVTDVTKSFDGDPSQWPTTMATTMGKKAFEMAPLINSSMLTPTRKGVLSYLQNEYGFIGTDEETGRQIKMEDLVDM